MLTTLIIPGYGGSGPDHWQTLWEHQHPNMRRVEAPDWERPVCDVWVNNLEVAVKAAGPGLVLVAHSLACLQVAQWVARPRSSTAFVRAALLVAPPDPASPVFPGTIIGFNTVPETRFPFSATVVYSTDDPYATVAWTEGMAKAWGARAVSVGAKGHINAASGMGEWREGQGLLENLTGNED